jgi:hypothetical protein
MRRGLITTLVAAAAVSAVAAPGAIAAPSGLEAYEVNASAKALRALALEGFDVTEARSGSKIEIVTTSAKAAKLRASGVEAEIKRNARGETATQFDARVQRDDGSYDVYRPYFDDTYVGTDAQGAKRQTLYEEMVQLARDHPRIVKTVTIGRSLNGKPILALKVTRNAPSRRDGSRPAVLYSAAQHAREWITPEMIRRLAHTVVESYGQDTETGRQWTPLVDDHELWFVVVSNPDGYDYTFTPGNRLWRKNLRDNNGDGQITDGDGVDPNRNFANKWGYDNEGSSPDPSDETFRGSGPNSEPETRAMDGLLRRIRFAFQVNYHSAAELLLYPFGFQVETPTSDDPIYRALSGTDERPAIDGVEGSGAPNDYDPDLGAELYTTNGETTDHAHVRYGTLAWTPEMDEADPARGGGGSVFEFQDSEGDVQDAYTKNVPFALDVAASAGDPTEPVSHLGNTTPDFEPQVFAVSHGDPQVVEVNAKRSLGSVRVRYRINGGRVRTAGTDEWDGGERFGEAGDVYYHRLRGTVRGTDPGDEVAVWFEARDGKRSEPFTYEAKGDSGNRVLILSAEDYTGTASIPEYPGTAGPYLLGQHTAALEANGIGYDVYDVDANGRAAPDRLGVLSHYRAVVWYTGNDFLTRDPDQGAGTGVAKLADDLIINVRSYLNEGGKLLYSGQWAVGAQANALAYNPAGEPPFCPPTGDVTNCVPLSDDFLQYYLGSYVQIDAAGAFGEGDKDAVSALTLQAEGRLGDTAFSLNGPESADNQEHVYSGVTTSSVLPPDEFPLFNSERVVAFNRPAAFDPLTGTSYAVARSADGSYQRLRKTIDLTGVTSTASLKFNISYDTEADFDYVFVEAHTAGQDDWTTLPDVNGNTSDSVGGSCDINWDTLHPWLARYQTNTNKSEEAGEEDCTPTGTTGAWNAASGNSGGYQGWEVDLSAYKGKQVEISITSAQDFAVAGLGAYVDDASVVKDGAAAEETSFEADFGGFEAGPAPEGSQPEPQWERTGSVGLVEGPGIATRDTVYLGFGLEGVSTAAQRATLVERALRHLGVRGSGGD